MVSWGRYRNLCLAVAGACFVAIVATVLVFGPANAGASQGGGVKVPGNPAKGAVVFRTKGCSGCHTLKAAKATGTIGPNLDKVKDSYARIVAQTEKGIGSFKIALSPAQLHDVAAYVYVSTH